MLPKTSRVTGKPVPIVDPYNAVDPLAESFFFEQWDAVAQHNTEVYRRVFRPMPDNDVKTWSEYKECVAYGERLERAQGGEKSKIQLQQGGASSPVGSTGTFTGLTSKVSKGEPTTLDDNKVRSWVSDAPKGEKETTKQDSRKTKEGYLQREPEIKKGGTNAGQEVQYAEKARDAPFDAENVLEHHMSRESEYSQTRRRRGKSNATRAGQFSVMPKETMEEFLSEVHGNLVVWPMDWLAKEDANGNFLYNIDKCHLRFDIC